MDRYSELNNQTGVERAKMEIKSALTSAWEPYATQVNAHLDKNPLSLVWDPNGERLHFMLDSTVYLEDPTSDDGIPMAPITLGVADPHSVERFLDARLDPASQGPLQAHCERLVSAWKDSDFAKCLVRELTTMCPQDHYRGTTAEAAGSALLNCQQWPQVQLSSAGGTYLARAGQDDHITHSYASSGARGAEAEYSLDVYSVRASDRVHSKSNQVTGSDRKSLYHHYDGAVKALNKEFKDPVIFSIGTSLKPVSSAGDAAPSLIAGANLRRLKSVYSVSKADLLVKPQAV